MTGFISKRNKVYLKDGIVVKECTSQKAALFEKNRLLFLKENGVAVPDVIGLDGSSLFLEYIEGITLPDLLEDGSFCGKSGFIAECIIAWFQSFYNAVQHSSTKEIRGDINGRNFIFTGTAVYGIDFEEIVFGEIAVDLGRFLAYLSTYALKDGSSRDEISRLLLDLFVPAFGISASTILAEKDRELAAIKLRRHKAASTG